MSPPSNSLAGEGVAAVAARVPAAEPVSPLEEAHFSLLRRAMDGRRPVRKAARTARFSAITILAIGIISIPLVLLSPSWAGFLVVTGICVIGVVEYIGSQRMRQGLPSAAVFLARNQLAFVAVILVYCLVQMLTFSSKQARSALISPEMQSQLSQLPGLEQDIEQELEFWAPIATYGFYSLVMVLSIGVQGSLALYYFTRKRHLEALAQANPPWVRRLFIELGV